MTIDNEELYKKYNIDIELYKGMPIDFDLLKIRTVNCLRGAGIYNIDVLLSATYSKLSGIKNLGMLSLSDIEEYIKSLDGMAVERMNKFDNCLSSKIKERRGMIFAGRFTEELYEGLNEQELEIVEEFKIGYDLLDNGLIILCRENPVDAYDIVKMLKRFALQMERFAVLDKLYDSVFLKVKNRLKPYYEVYSLQEGVSEEFKSFCKNENVLFGTLFDKVLSTSVPIEEKIRFVKWASFDLKKELDFFLEKYYARSVNTQKVLVLRAKKNTLQVIGDELGITRERVRQIEKKVVQPFCQWQRTKRFLPRLSAEFNGKTILNATDLQEYFGEMTEVLLYLLQCADDEFFSYDRNTDTVIIVDDDITDRAREYVERMPDELGVDTIEEYENEATDEYSIPIDIFEREIDRQYKISGTVYHRNKLSLEKMYHIVMKRYYPAGMNVYDDEELTRFRSLLINEFGDVSLPEKNRAISAAIGRTCILCGRGKYRVKENDMIPHKLLKRIWKFIMKSDRRMFFMNEIFLEFENELRQEGIDNRFFLQGILREEYENDLFFRKDYVSKDSENLSMYRDIQLFIKKSEYPVTKEQIRAAYPGITEIMISIALNDEDIINYFGSYIHSDNLNLYAEDKIYIDNVVGSIIADGIPHHCDEIFSVIENSNQDMLSRLGIFYQYSLFSLLQYLYKEQYEFARPYIAEKGVNINKPIELLQEYVSANEMFEIAELLGLAKEYHYLIYDILKFLIGWNDTHLLINKEEMAAIEYIGITSEIANEVEQQIVKEIDDSTLIINLKCIYNLPAICVPWNEWLVYSVINKWGKELEVHTTSNQFRLSSPVVSRIGKFNREDYDDSDSGEMVQAIDLNDIGAVEDYIMEDFEIEW
ncbi:MAG: hypothetical protein HFG38_13170 [Eubacterium sp.]|nr:hypothetical protein [Eubacterium sp.]